MHNSILKAMIEECSKHGYCSLMLTHITRSDTYMAEVSNAGVAVLDPISRKIRLEAEGMSPGDALSKLETLLQQWY